LANKKKPQKVVRVWSFFFCWLASGKVFSQPMKIVNNEFTGTTESMIQKWATLSKLENETYLKIIMGQLDISAFDDFAKKWTELGGEQVTQEVRELAGK